MMQTLIFAYIVGIIYFIPFKSDVILYTTKEYILLCLIILLWPITSLVALPYIFYMGFRKSASQIKVDLKNQGLLKEFYEFLDSKKQALED